MKGLGIKCYINNMIYLLCYKKCPSSDKDSFTIVQESWGWSTGAKAQICLSLCMSPSRNLASIRMGMVFVRGPPNFCNKQYPKYVDLNKVDASFFLCRSPSLGLRCLCLFQPSHSQEEGNKDLGAYSQSFQGKIEKMACHFLLFHWSETVVTWLLLVARMARYGGGLQLSSVCVCVCMWVCFKSDPETSKSRERKEIQLTLHMPSDSEIDKIWSPEGCPKLSLSSLHSRVGDILTVLLLLFILCLS